MRYNVEADVCRDAFLAQSAPNLRALAGSLVEMLDFLQERLDLHGERRFQHPAIQLMAHQMAWLAHGSSPADWDYCAAYRVCEDIIARQVGRDFVAPEHREGT